ncbi:MAG: cell division protein FtsZ, partial [Bacteroidia bacterium]
EIITIAGSINVDFEDVKTAMTNSGVAILGNGVAEGDDRATRAAELALTSPLLNDNKITGASDLLINISYGDEEARMDEYAAINEFFQEQAGMDANLKCGLCYDESLGAKVSVTIIATGFHKAENRYTGLDAIVEEEGHIIEAASYTPEEDTENPTKPKKQTSIFDFIEGSEEDEDEIRIANTKVEEMKERIVKLKELSKTANSQEGMEELENVPAYKRRGVKLSQTLHSSETDISRTSLVDEPESKPEIKTNNSFLHDNVD